MYRITAETTQGVITKEFTLMSEALFYWRGLSCIRGELVIVRPNGTIEHICYK